MKNIPWDPIIKISLLKLGLFHKYLLLPDGDIEYECISVSWTPWVPNNCSILCSRFLTFTPYSQYSTAHRAASILHLEEPLQLFFKFAQTIF